MKKTVVSMKKKTGFRVMLFVLSVLFTVMVLSAKGCEVNTKADILEVMPEILPGLTIDPDKFDVRINNGVIVLTTYDNMSFLEAIKKLKNETPMNKPIFISMPFYGERIGSEGEFRTEHTVDEVISFAGERLRPYIGIIRIYDGYWIAMEFDATLLFTNGEINADDIVLVTEYAYSNETVYNINRYSSRHGLMSHFDRTTPRTRYIQGDGSMPNDIISEFDRR
jgi:hypothetical protein